ncbi:hypothetical protein GA0115240_140618 [Streptomyces sp. DvalAA-14]|uniref:hypothetical protein n=1 Tax=unclassified Streptomyces TaxID=2593676 RepID=UPI00081B4415|nr:MULTISPECIES: hypothetical protein [unclassified Streptomyces]MYS22341.1 hypothetical protein [Streptomyces sp. SID4948]SCE14264.1 hypothetical protein GA0115240_140618 [Streptomyces sp. DvalAA-14]
MGYTLQVPGSWFEVDVRPATRAASAAELVGARLTDLPELRARRADVVRLIRKQAAGAWDAGAVYCAVMAEPVADGLLTACVTVSFVAGPADARSDAEDRIGPLIAQLTSTSAQREDDPWTEVTTLELPHAGPAARSHGVEDVEDAASGRSLRAVTMQTFVPLPDVNRVAIVSCSSPAVEVAPALLDVFDAVTETFRLFRTADLLERRP